MRFRKLRFFLIRIILFRLKLVITFFLPRFLGTNNIHLSAIIPVENGSNISGDTLHSSCAQSRFLKDSARCGQSHLLKSNLSNIFVAGFRLLI